MGLEPGLGLEDFGVAVVSFTFEDDVGGEAVLVPLEGEGAGDFLGGGDAGVAGDEIEDEVVPGHGGAGGDEVFAEAGDDEDALGVDSDGGVGGGEVGGEAVVDGGVFAVEEAGFREEIDAGAGGAEDGAVRVPLGDPLEKLGVSALGPASGGEEDRGHDDDVGFLYVRDGLLDFDGDAAGEGEGAGPLADDGDAEGRGGLGEVEEVEGVKDVVNAAQGGDDRVGDGDEAYVERGQSGIDD